MSGRYTRAWANTGSLPKVLNRGKLDSRLKTRYSASECRGPKHYLTTALATHPYILCLFSPNKWLLCIRKALSLWQVWPSCYTSFSLFSILVDSLEFPRSTFILATNNESFVRSCLIMMLAGSCCRTASYSRHLKCRIHCSFLEDSFYLVN